MHLPTEAKSRKAIPIATGCIDYFPLALAAVAELSRKGNDQHNPGKPLFWDRTKSQDEADALMRHFIDRGKLDVDGSRHSVKVAWRALALLQKELEAVAKAEEKAQASWNDIRKQAQQPASQAHGPMVGPERPGAGAMGVGQAPSKCVIAPTDGFCSTHCSYYCLKPLA